MVSVLLFSTTRKKTHVANLNLQNLFCEVTYWSLSSFINTWDLFTCLQPPPLVSSAPALRLTLFWWPMPEVRPAGTACPPARWPLSTKTSGR